MKFSKFETFAVLFAMAAILYIGWHLVMASNRVGEVQWSPPAPNTVTISSH